METQAVAGIQQMREMINNGKNRCVYSFLLEGYNDTTF